MKKRFLASLRALRLAMTPKLCQILPLEVEEHDDFETHFLSDFFII
jgi:hypothetical protein